MLRYRSTLTRLDQSGLLRQAGGPSYSAEESPRLSFVDDQVLLGAVDGGADVVQDACHRPLCRRGGSQHRRLEGDEERNGR